MQLVPAGCLLQAFGGLLQGPLADLLSAALPDCVLKPERPGPHLPELTLKRTLRFILVCPGMAFPMNCLWGGMNMPMSG